MTDERYLWHETIQTQHTRRSWRSEVAPEILATVSEWLATGDDIVLPMGYRCRIVLRSPGCLQAEVFTPNGIRLCVLGVACPGVCGESLWAAIGGDPQTKPGEPWCGAWLDPAGQLADKDAYLWLGDFERCLAWGFLAAQS